MDVLDVITILVIMAALFTLINAKVLKLPSTIGLMILALSLSIFVVVGESLFRTLKELAVSLMTEYNFSDVLLNVMLSFLLFAGALQINLKKLGEEKWTVFLLATFGVIISAFVTGTLMYYLLPLVHIQFDYLYCLLFGALISPTDPISVLAMIKQTRASKNLESQISGESLFNDGTGVVVFLTILHLVTLGTTEQIHISSAVLLFIQEVAGGIGVGIVIGAVGFYLLKIIPNELTEIEVLVTLSMVLGGTGVAEFFHVSGPLAMVTMGIMVGKEGRSEKFANVTGEYVYKFWHLLDESLNAILFILIGLQVIIISWKLDYFYAAGFAIVAVLISRFFGVAIPISAVRLKRKLPKYTIRVLTWSGLRGGISVALALSLYDTVKKYGVDHEIIDLIIAMTYSVVVFSIVVQGLTMKRVFDKIAPPTENMPGLSEPQAPE